MPSVVSAMSDLVSSLVELFWSFFTTTSHLVQNTVQSAAKFASEIVELVINFLKGPVDLAGGLVSFLVGEYLPFITSPVCDAMLECGS
jgi:phage-related protein